MDKLKISRLALALAILCVIVNVINFFVPFNTYGVDNFLLAALMGVLAFNFKNDERMRGYWVLCLVMAVLSAVSGVMRLMGMCHKAALPDFGPLSSLTIRILPAWLNLQ